MLPAAPRCPAVARLTAAGKQHTPRQRRRHSGKLRLIDAKAATRCERTPLNERAHACAAAATRRDRSADSSPPELKHSMTPLAHSEEGARLVHAVAGAAEAGVAKLTACWRTLHA